MKPSWKVIICWGLPGSGKTYYCNEEVKKYPNPYSCSNRPRALYIDLDRYKLEEVHLLMPNKSLTNIYIYFDGLILTNDDASKLLAKIFDYHSKQIAEVEIVYWRESREACLWNDKGRRKLNSTTTIKASPYEYPDIAKLMEPYPKVKASVVHKDIILKPKSSIFIDDVNGGEPYLKSDRWVTGGSRRDYRDNTYPVSPEAPLEFDEFDNLLESLWPDIPFFTYKRLRRETTTVMDGDESDYYGGTTYYQYHHCDLKLLYQMLDEELEKRGLSLLDRP